MKELAGALYRNRVFEFLLHGPVAPFKLHPALRSPSLHRHPVVFINIPSLSRLAQGWPYGKYFPDKSISKYL
jgi:hypothetical protein